MGEGMKEGWDRKEDHGPSKNILPFLLYTTLMILSQQIRPKKSYMIRISHRRFKTMTISSENGVVKGNFNQSEKTYIPNMV